MQAYWFLMTTASNWSPFGTGLPNVPVLDLSLHEPTRTLVAATYGRSMFRTNLQMPVNTENPSRVVKFDIYPNPVGEKLQIQFDAAVSQKTEIRVWNIVGGLVFQKIMTTPLSNLEINTGKWNPGVYLVQWQGVSRKVVKR